MVDIGPAGVRSGSAGAGAPASYVEWGAVLAGAFLAAAISFVLLTFGAAIGLSATSPWPGSGVSAKVIASIAVFWAMAQQIGAFMAGGYVAGRMRSRWHETGHEADFRDGVHGGLVWAVGVVIGAALLFTAAGSATKAGIEAASGAAVASASSGDPMDAIIDGMVRPTSTAAAAPPPPSPAGPGAARNRPASAEDPRSEMSRVLTSAVASGSLTPENRTYLAQIVAQRSGIPQPEAERRVDQAFTAAREAADKARKAAILTGFVTGGSLILSLAAAWWAAMRGGNHRDQSVPARFEFGTRHRRVTPSA